MRNSFEPIWLRIQSLVGNDFETKTGLPNYGQHLPVTAMTTKVLQTDNSGSSSTALSGGIAFVSNRDDTGF